MERFVSARLLHFEDKNVTKKIYWHETETGKVLIRRKFKFKNR